MPGFEEEYIDVLQNIEHGIVSAYRENPQIADHHVLAALEAVIDGYRAENIGRPPRQFNLSEPECQVRDRVRLMCEWRLGRAEVRIESEDPENPVRITEPKTVDETVLCLKRILKSVGQWNRRRGRRGYLEFIVQHVL